MYGSISLSFFRSRSLRSFCEEEELRSNIEARRYSSSAVDRYPYLFLPDRVGNRVRIAWSKIDGS